MIGVEVVFWCLLSLIVTAMVGYPVFIAIAARVRNIQIDARIVEPRVSVIVSAFNEQKHIADKIENLLAQDYPADKFEVIIASDSSEDATHDIVERYADRRVRLVVRRPRAGKTAAQNKAAESARGDVLVFTDATTQFADDMVRRIVRPLADARVGCVGAELVYEDQQGTQVGAGNSAYWRYERFIKDAEARAGSLVGVSGCLYAVRASAFPQMPDDLQSDFAIAGYVREQGLITTYGRGVVSYEDTNASADREFRMRVRVAVRAINVLIRRAKMLNPFRYGLFAVQLLMHKALRYAMPLAMVALLPAHVILATQVGPRQTLYVALALPHAAIYVAAVLGASAQRTGWRIPGVHLAYYFVLGNLALLRAWIEYSGGQRYVTWNTARKKA